MKYKILCHVYFPSQDGYDYMTHDADGELYSCYEDAKKQCDLYKKDCSYNHKFSIELLED